jgi:hypothetical protein
MADDKHAHRFADSSCWEHISTWNMHDYLSKGTAVFQIEFSSYSHKYWSEWVVSSKSQSHWMS